MYILLFLLIRNMICSCKRKKVSSLVWKITRAINFSKNRLFGSLIIAKFFIEISLFLSVSVNCLHRIVLCLASPKLPTTIPIHTAGSVAKTLVYYSFLPSNMKYHKNENAIKATVASLSTLCRITCTDPKPEVESERQRTSASLSCDSKYWVKHSIWSRHIVHFEKML